MKPPVQLVSCFSEANVVFQTSLFTILFGQVTHVVAANFGQFLEKVMGGLVSGAWVVTRRYIDTSYNKGTWANTRQGNTRELFD